MINAPYGTVSRIVAELANEGYIEKLYHQATQRGKKIYEKQEWHQAVPRLNSEMRVKGKINWCYSDSPVSRQQIYITTDRWKSLIQRWNTFLAKGIDPGPLSESEARKPKKPKKMTPPESVRAPIIH
jgi:hypothetical protein